MDYVKPPIVATTVTALDGQLAYKVLAHRELDYAEVVHLVSVFLEQGWIKEPEAGEIATIYASIGLPSAVAGQPAQPIAPSAPAIPTRIHRQINERWLEVGL